jgi:O-antigen ligase
LRLSARLAKDADRIRVVEGRVAPSRQARIGQVILYGTFGLLLLGPLAFGAVEPWSIFVLEAGAALLFAAWMYQQYLSPQLQVVSNPLFFPMLAFAGLVLLQLLLRRSAYSYETISRAQLYLAYGLLCFLAVQSLRRTRDLARLAAIFSIYGFAVALFAVAQSLSSNGKLYWLRTPRFGGWIYGPYVNHNHYAGLMELLLPIPVVLLISRRVRPGPKLLLTFVALLMASTIFLSGSRGGMFAFVVQAAWLALYLGTRRKSPRTALALGAFVLLLGAALLWLGGSTLAERLATFHSEAKTEITSGVRTTINRDGLRMFGERPLLGWGLGTFPTVYPQFRSFYTNLFVNEAHNDYLQLLVEMGVLGALIVFWFLLRTFLGGLQKLRGETMGINGGLALATLLGCAGILVHSFVDFNLQIPANAALFYVFATLAASQPLAEPGRQSR